MKRIPLADLRPPPGSKPLLTPYNAQEVMRADLRRRLAGREKAALAAELGLGELQLTLAVRGGSISPEIARALGYRKVIRFEKVE